MSQEKGPAGQAAHPVPEPERKLPVRLTKRRRRRPCAEWPNCECPKCEAYRRRQDNKAASQDRPSRIRGVCHYCTETATTMDHTVPKSKGGREKVPCCVPCNKAKADIPYEDWLLIVRHGLLKFVKGNGGKKALAQIDLDELRYQDQARA